MNLKFLYSEIYRLNFHRNQNNPLNQPTRALNYRIDFIMKKKPTKDHIKKNEII